jgi:eukaryotic-like serine/threonine-protein kinase
MGYNQAPLWLLSQELASVPTRSSTASARAAWVLSMVPAICASIVRSPSNSSRSRWRPSRARERLRREAIAAAAFDHPFICQVFEIREDGDMLFLVMEYIAGETLAHRLEDGRMPLPDILRVAGEIAEALQEAHARGFLHRDLKPANIMLTELGHVKIMDFGLAKRLLEMPGDGDTTVTFLTTPGTIIGTPAYMSPEQVKGQPLDVRSDLFSFGVILAEMISGRHLFRKPSPAERMARRWRQGMEIVRSRCGT